MHRSQDIYKNEYHVTSQFLSLNMESLTFFHPIHVEVFNSETATWWL